MVGTAATFMFSRTAWAMLLQARRCGLPGKMAFSFWSIHTWQHKRPFPEPVMTHYLMGKTRCLQRGVRSRHRIFMTDGELQANRLLGRGRIFATSMTSP